MNFVPSRNSQIAEPIERLEAAEATMLATKRGRATSPISLAVPGHRHVLSTVVEPFGRPIRSAAEAIRASLDKANLSTKCCDELSLSRSKTSPIQRTDGEVVAWAILSAWAVGIASNRLEVNVSLVEAVSWFWGPSLRKHGGTVAALRKAIALAEQTLEVAREARPFYDLLPYILDPHGPGSRLSVRRDPNTAASRTRRRNEGVFYTPADVADYMVRACVRNFPAQKVPLVLDPACGTGVFLRAALATLAEKNPNQDWMSLASENLFGIDIDPLVVNTAAHVLTADVLRHTNTTVLPIQLWQAIRKNLACIDALLVDPPQADSSTPRVSLSTLFPPLKEGAGIVIGNPPYTNIGSRRDLAALGNAFETIAAKPNSNAEIYVAFLEQAILLSAVNEAAAALVLPLSLAYNLGAQFLAARQIIGRTSGDWKFAFFDREPHALFGEDVKTRNAIVIWSKRKAQRDSRLFTGPLLKWRGATRAKMLRAIEFTPIQFDVRHGIPKLGGLQQAHALEILSRRCETLESAVESIEKTSLADALSDDDRTVFVGPTAYNFLNVFLKPDYQLKREQLPSEHPLHAIRCATRNDAYVVFAILSSHLAYWCWHTFGDGFHVSRRFISELAFGLDAFQAPTRSALHDSGESLWSVVKSQPIISNNRGRTSLAYSPNGFDALRRQADEALAKLAGLDDSFVDELQQFTARAVTVKVKA